MNASKIQELLDYTCINITLLNSTCINITLLNNKCIIIKWNIYIKIVSGKFINKLDKKCMLNHAQTYTQKDNTWKQPRIQHMHTSHVNNVLHKGLPF